MLKLHGSNRILVLGFGDPEFMDEGLGPAVAEAVHRMELPGVTGAWCDELDVESAATVAACDVVVFAAAALSGPAPFAFRPIRVAREMPPGGLTGLEPPGLLYLAQRLYRRVPEAYGLAVRGCEFGAGPGLSDGAKTHMDKALAFLEAAIQLKLAA